MYWLHHILYPQNLLFIQEAAKMVPRLGNRQVLIYLLCIAAIGVLSRYSWDMSLHYLGPENSGLCACHKCLTEGDPWFRELINSSPTPFLSRNYTSSEDDFNWWKININLSFFHIISVLIILETLTVFGVFFFWSFIPQDEPV